MTKRIPWNINPATGIHVLWEDHSIAHDDIAPHKGAFCQQSVGYVKEQGVDKRGNRYIIFCMHWDEHGDPEDCITILEKNIVRRRKA